MESTDPNAKPLPEAGFDDQTAAAEDAEQIALAQIDALQAELTQLREERLRERADLENQRRRLSRDLEQARRFANERLLSDLLPVLDSLDKGLEADGDVKHLRDGVELTQRQLLKAATDHGLEVVDPAGMPFNPEHHQAMSMVPASGQVANTVVQVYQKGYLLNQRLLRPAMVVVATDE